MKCQLLFLESRISIEAIRLPHLRERCKKHPLFRQD